MQQLFVFTRAFYFEVAIRYSSFDRFEHLALRKCFHFSKLNGMDRSSIKIAIAKYIYFFLAVVMLNQFAFFMLDYFAS